MQTSHSSGGFVGTVASWWLLCHIFNPWYGTPWLQEIKKNKKKKNIKNVKRCRDGMPKSIQICSKWYSTVSHPHYVCPASTTYFQTCTSPKTLFPRWNAPLFPASHCWSEVKWQELQNYVVIPTRGHPGQASSQHIPPSPYTHWRTTCTVAHPTLYSTGELCWPFTHHANTVVTDGSCSLRMQK